MKELPIKAVSADIDETLSFALLVSRKLSSDELFEIGSVLQRAAEQIKQETALTNTVPGTRQ